MSPKRVTYVAQELQRDNTPPPPKRIGRPLKVTPDIIQMVDYNTLIDPHLGGIKLAGFIAQRLGIRLSHTTVNEIRANLRLFHNSPCQTASDG